MKLILSTLLFTSIALGCNIKTSGFILKLSKKIDSSIILKSNCSNTIQSKFLKAINDISGKVHSRSLSSMLNTPNLEITPKIVEVQSLHNFVANHFNKEVFKISQVNSITSKKHISLNKASDLKINCNNCSTSGHKNFKISTDNENIWLSAKFLKAKEVIVLKKDFRKMGGSLSVDDIEIQKVFVNTNQNLFFDHNNIQHYKINKFIPKGHILKTYDLSAINLITLGRTVDLIVKSDNISLKTKATARQSGVFGKDIELINLKTKKKVLAKVTGKNEATISL